jgi:hypothetical protein
VIESTYPEFKGTLDGEVKLLSNAPSKEAQAGLVFGQIGKKLSEVNGAYNEIRDLLSR